MPTTPRSRRRPDGPAAEALDEQAPALVRPTTLAQQETRKHKPGGVRREVVAVDLRPLEVSGDVVAVEPEHAEQPLTEGVVAPRRALAERADEPGQRDRAERGLHRHRPVHRPRVRVLLVPLDDRVAHGLGVALVAGELVRLPGGQEPLQARQLPRDLHVAAFAVGVIDPRRVADRPPSSRDEVAAPVDRRGQVDRAGAQEVDSTRQRSVGGGEHPPALRCRLEPVREGSASDHGLPSVVEG